VSQLPTPLRNQLARVIKEARRVGDEGAREAREALVVGRAEAYASVREDEHAPRRRLWAHGWQLGDRGDRWAGEQNIHRVGREVACEHWHRMVFARFLAENGLLLEPERGVAVSLDLFIRGKPLHAQPIGWDPDLDDGVRLNIRPFMRAELEKGGRKGAVLLRFKPNIKWTKDRGKEPQSLRPKEDFPWFWSCPGDGTTDFMGADTYDGNRWNDLHYTNATKRRAREKAAKGEER